MDGYRRLERPAAFLLRRDAALLLFAVSPVGGTNGGTTGAAPAMTATAFQYRLTVSPGGPADRAVLRTGDRIDLRALAPAERFAFAYDHFMPGNRVVFPRLGDDGRVTRVPVVAAGSSQHRASALGPSYSVSPEKGAVLAGLYFYSWDRTYSHKMYCIRLPRLRCSRAAIRSIRSRSGALSRTEIGAVDGRLL